MQQIKIFKGIESDLHALETEVNEWLASGNGRVVNMFGNIAPQTIAAGKSAQGTFSASDVLLVVLYETD
jgi:hypothetical protein